LTVGGDPNAPGIGSAQGPFALGDVDGEPRRVGGASPDYPLWARRRGIEGSALLRFVVDAEGRVSQVRVVSTEGSARFGDVARRTIDTWRFEPATKDGRPVAVKCQQRVEFRLR
jgi:protein TonB